MQSLYDLAQHCDFGNRMSRSGTISSLEYCNRMHRKGEKCPAYEDKVRVRVDIKRLNKAVISESTMLCPQVRLTAVAAG